MIGCPEPRCGQAATAGGAAHTGWVKLTRPGTDHPTAWYCSTSCAMRALGVDLPGEAARPDVGNCQQCATRHDIGHLCRSCGHTPPRPQFTFGIRSQAIADARAAISAEKGRPHPNLAASVAQRIRDNGWTAAQIRTWCALNGHPVGSTGSLPAWAVDLYEDANPTIVEVPHA